MMTGARARLSRGLRKPYGGLGFLLLYFEGTVEIYLDRCDLAILRKLERVTNSAASQ